MPAREKSPGAIIYREASPGDLPALLALRNQIFPPISEKQFRSVPGLTAVVACAGEEAVGALPLAVREFQLGPEQTCRAAFLHAVGTHPAWRGCGIGRQMVACARETLRHRAEALFVYRTGGERTDGYAFYQKAGFHELLFATTCRIKRSRAQTAGSTVPLIGAEEIIAREATLLEIFHSLYGGCGGYWARTKGFYRRALHSSYYCSRPHEFSLWQRIHDAHPTAYAIVGRPLLPQDAHRRVILEIAARPNHLQDAADLLAAVELAMPPDAEIRFPTSTASPLWPHLQPHFQEEAVRTPVLLGCLLEPEHWARRAWKGRVGAPHVTAWTPHRDLVLHGTGAERSLTIGLKEDALLRLLLRRLDLRAAISLEAATLHHAQPGDADLLAAALPAFPWVYHGLDYL